MQRHKKNLSGMWDKMIVNNQSPKRTQILKLPGPGSYNSKDYISDEPATTAHQFLKS